MYNFIIINRQELLMVVITRWVHKPTIAEEVSALIWMLMTAIINSLNIVVQNN